MAEGLNKVMLLGNLGADPELKITQGGQAVLKLRLATTETYLDKNNTRQEKTEWHSVTVWGKRGEALSKILAKGANIFVEGSIRTSSYEKNGEKRYSTEVVASNILLTGRRPAGDAGEGRGFSDRGGGERGYAAGGGGRAPSREAPREVASPAAGDDEFGGGDGGGGGAGDDEIPF